MCLFVCCQEQKNFFFLYRVSTINLISFFFSLSEVWTKRSEHTPVQWGEWEYLARTLKSNPCAKWRKDQFGFSTKTERVNMTANLCASSDHVLPSRFRYVWLSIVQKNIMPFSYLFAHLRLQTSPICTCPVQRALSHFENEKKN